MLYRAMRLCGFVAMGILFAGAALAEPLNAPQWHFSATFPCQSQISGQTVDTAAGAIVITMYSCGGEKTGYFVGINDFPKGTAQPEKYDNIYAGAASSSATAAKGTIRSMEVFVLADHPGREVIIDAPDAVIRARLFVIGDRLFQVIYYGAKGSEISDDANKFFNSFTLIDIAALTNPASPPPK